MHDELTRREVVADFRRAVAAHDADAVVECFTEDCRFELPNHPGRSFSGREQARRNRMTIVDLDEEGRLASARFFVEYVDQADTSIGEHLAGLKGS